MPRHKPEWIRPRAAPGSTCAREVALMTVICGSTAASPTTSGAAAGLPCSKRSRLPWGMAPRCQPPGVSVLAPGKHQQERSRTMAQIRRKDVDSLAKKLEGFSKDLPQQEQQVFNWLLTRARSVSEGELSDADLNAVSGG